MRAYSLLAPAKINLHLEIVGARTDGFHELIMVMQSVEFADRVDIALNGKKTAPYFALNCDSQEVPHDPTNLAYRAAELMAQHFPKALAQYGGVDLVIHKHLPVGAGLAGGSGNAAAVLVGLDLLWDLGLTQDELHQLGAQLGSDVPFSISGGTALATGRGERLDPLPDLAGLWVVLAKYRKLAVSTPWAYQTYRQQFAQTYCAPDDFACRQQQVHSGEMMRAIAHRDTAHIGQLLYNDLEKVVLPAHPEVAALKQAFLDQRPLGAMMSGSGPTVFALCSTEAEAKTIQAAVETQISNPDLAMWITQLRPTGIQVISHPGDSVK
jgi:4-diphosphocytidyl-2-C-methyl-D-erythritol kinase